MRRARGDRLALTPADLRALRAEADHPDHPAQQGTGVALLDVHIDGLEAVRAAGDDRRDRLLRGGEAGVGLRRPLHRRAHGATLAERQVVAHPDLVAVVDDGRPRQREHEAVRELEPPAVAEHRRQPAADPPVVELHAWLRAEALEDRLPLLLRQAAEVELVVVAEELGPLGSRRQLAGGAQRLRERLRVSRGERVEGVLVDPEVEHHVQPAALAEVPARLLGKHVRLAEQHCVADPPLDEAPHLLQVLEAQWLRAAVRRRLLEDERDGVEPEAGDAEREPETHDPADLLPHLGVLHVQIRLEVVEAVEVVLPHLGCARPRPLLDTREDHPRLPVRWTLLRPDVPVVVRRGRRPAGVTEPRVPVGRVVDDEIHDHADAPALRLVEELDEVAQRAVAWIDAVVVGDVVPVVPVGSGLERA